MKPYELCLDLVSLYPVSVGPQLILFSRTTSKSLIRNPLQANSSCLFASGYLLAKAARKGVIGECLIRGSGAALGFPPPSTRRRSPAGKSPGWPGPSYWSWPLAVWSGREQEESSGKVGVQKWQVKPCKSFFPHQQPLRLWFHKRMYSNMCMGWKCHRMIYMHLHTEMEKCHCAGAEFCDTEASI